MSEKKSSKRKIEICIESPKKIKIEKKYETFPLTKIISGGQTGADFGALMAAEVLGIQTGGTAPQEFWTSDGKCPELGSRFKLVELSLKKPSTLSMIASQKFGKFKILRITKNWHIDLCWSLKICRTKQTFQK
jgi:hypothetical protein